MKRKKRINSEKNQDLQELEDFLVVLSMTLKERSHGTFLTSKMPSLSNVLLHTFSFTLLV